MLCSIAHCDRSRSSRGWCNLHYQRWVRTGNPIGLLGRPIRHGHSLVGYVTPEYSAWRSMLKRCYNRSHPSFKYYGARGIKVYLAWRKSFESFLGDVGYRPSTKYTLERIFNDRGYEPGNVRWATAKEQARNRRNNRVIEVGGESHCLSEWAEITGINRARLEGRFKRGWTPEKIIDPRLWRNR
jgi:hypothetical protein